MIYALKVSHINITWDLQVAVRVILTTFIVPCPN